MKIKIIRINKQQKIIHFYLKEKDQRTSETIVSQSFTKFRDNNITRSGLQDRWSTFGICRIGWVFRTGTRSLALYAVALAKIVRFLHAIAQRAGLLIRELKTEFNPATIIFYLLWFN
jgi:phosphoribosylaminoimidazole-succinocarboxamide synthase